MQLSSKDLLYLTDEMSWELLAMKKCHHFAQECQDPQIAQIINQMGAMHQRHYETLLSQVQTASHQTGANPTSTMMQ
ncbi:hypothetical protein [Hazenella coriacea]|uniref:Coat F domain-containing protein n=1 Tax=Hazenella coriacea TaxID=1179467 RepID=A0A4R3LEY5_9BACL|nr:hypothetical protein [Hazenella coriacea]TCS96924.1 hypothetical protein EDD58_101571 [Hazenella coriacea]